MGLLVAILLSVLVTEAYAEEPLTLDEPSEFNKQLVNEAIRKLQTLSTGNGGNETEALEQTQL